MDVPLIHATVLSPVPYADSMFTPGAKMSTHDPQSENDARWSLLSLAATVMASAVSAGETVQASVLSFAAATTYVTPEATEARTASSSARSAGPPRLRLATAGLTAFAVTQSIPAMICEYDPLPEQSSTRTPTNCTLLATPKVAPPMVPATCVPCPLQSSATGSLSMKSQPLLARPPNSTCVVRSPVSMTYACTVAVGTSGYMYQPPSGNPRWSIRSRPHDGGCGCAPDRATRASCWTYATAGSAAIRAACPELIRAEKPWTALSYSRTTAPPYRPVNAYGFRSKSLSTTMYEPGIASGPLASTTLPTGSAYAVTGTPSPLPSATASSRPTRPARRPARPIPFPFRIRQGRWWPASGAGREPIGYATVAYQGNRFALGRQPGGARASGSLNR